MEYTLRTQYAEEFSDIPFNGTEALAQVGALYQLDRDHEALAVDILRDGVLQFTVLPTGRILPSHGHGYYLAR